MILLLILSKRFFLAWFNYPIFDLTTASGFKAVADIFVALSWRGTPRD